MGFSCLLFLNSSCVKSKEEAELVGQNAENRQAFILRNVAMVAEIQNLMREKCFWTIPEIAKPVWLCICKMPQIVD